MRGLVHRHMSLPSLRQASQLRRGGVSTYPSTHNPPVHQSHLINKHLHTSPSTSAMTPQTSQSAPVTYRGQTVSALSMPSAKRLVAFWAVLSKPRPLLLSPPPGKWSHHSQHGPTNLLSLLLPHTFLHMPLKKFLRLPARRSQRFCGVQCFALAIRLQTGQCTGSTSRACYTVPSFIYFFFSWRLTAWASEKIISLVNVGCFGTTLLLGP